MDVNPAPVLFTVGHSNHELDRLVAMLADQRIDVVADVRSSPFSRYSPQFNAPSLEAGLVQQRIRYVPMGDQLGGRPTGLEFYDADGHVLYGRLARAPFFEDGIERLIDGIARFRVAILCSEESPVDCHRRLLIGRVMLERGVALVHIRRDGQAQDEAAVVVEESLEHPDRIQLGFFSTEEDTWRSTRSVSPSGLPATSSAHSGRQGSGGW